MSTLALDAPATREEVPWAWGSISGFEWFFVVFGGLPLILLMLTFVGEQQLGQVNPINYYFWVNAIVSAPHVYSTLLRLGRKIHQGKVSWLVGLPAYLGFVAILGIGTWKGYWLQLMTAVNVWQSFHYARQGYGVHAFYSRGPAMDGLQRKLSWLAFHLAMPLFVLGRWHVLWLVWDGKPSDAIIPVSLSLFSLRVCWALAIVGIGLAVVAEVRRASRTVGAFSPVGIFTAATYFGMHIFGFLQIEYYQRGFFAVTVFHAVQYLALVWVLEQKSQSAVSTRLSKIGGRAGFYLFWVAIFALAYFWEQFVTVEASKVVTYFSAVALGAISAHHYFADAFIWRGKVGA